MNTHVHQYELAPAQISVKTVPPPSPVAQRTRSKQHRATWENTPWGVADADIADLLDFLYKSDDPWERSLIPGVEKNAISRQAKRAKKDI
jgi:hypothetical protein